MVERDSLSVDEIVSGFHLDGYKESITSLVGTKPLTEPILEYC